MILDTVEHLGRYDLPFKDVIADLLRQQKPDVFIPGETEIRGRDLFLRAMEYATKSAQDNRFETHRVYADVQYIVKGTEIMQAVPSCYLKPLSEYDQSGDYQFFTAHQGISDIVVPQGWFAVFFPGEAHRPCCHYGGQPGEVRKFVFKIRMT
jgi:YhcH/YjgK/YiaL family protein